MPRLLSSTTLSALQRARRASCRSSTACPRSLRVARQRVRGHFSSQLLIDTNIRTEIAVLASSTPSQLELNLTQHYVFKSPIPFKKEGTEKTVNSKLTFKLNSQGLIEEHIEEWDHEGNKTADDGFMGKLQEQRKKFDAKLVEKTVSSDPSKA